MKSAAPWAEAGVTRSLREGNDEVTGREALRPRLLIAVLAGLAIAVAAGCTSTIDGHGTLAAADDEPTDGPTDRPTDNPTDEPTDDPTDEPTGDPTGDPGDGDVSRDSEAQASPVCQLFGDDELLDMFGGPLDVTVPYSDPSCEFRMRGSSTEYIDLTVYPDQDPSYRMLDDATPVTVSGHPGLQDAVTISVSLGDDVNALGCIQGDNYFIENDPLGDTIDQTMVERAIDEFATS